jgi:hypothetical protein
MSTWENKYTIRDAMIRATNQGELIDLADTVSKATGIMQFLEFHPTNQAFDHLTARRTDQGTPTTRIANEGAQEIKASSEQVIDIPVHYKKVIKPDKLCLRKFNSPEQWKADEVRAIFQAYAEEYTEQLISGDSLTDPGRSIDGFAKRLGSLPSDVNDVTDRYHTVRSGGGAGADNTSIYVLGIGKQGVYGLFHKNGQAGFQMKQLPEQLIPLGTGDIVSSPIDLSWDVGLSATNHRAMGRLCNIDYSDLTDDASAGVNLMNELTRLINSTKVKTMGLKPVMLANESIITYFENQRRNFGGNGVGDANADIGKMGELTTFKGIPFVQTDAIGIAEAVVS